MGSLDSKTIRIHEESSRDFSSIKNKEISKQDQILDRYLDDELNKYDDDFNEIGPSSSKQKEENPFDDVILPQEKSSEVKKKKRELRGLIKRYLGSVFGEYLNEFKVLNLVKLDLSKLEETLEEIEYTVECHENQSFSREGFGMLIGLSENILVNKGGIKCQGLALKLIRDEKAMRLVDRIR
jgi:hypothetical protein